MKRAHKLGEQARTSTDVDLKEKEPSYTVGSIENHYQSSWKKVKIELVYDPVTSLLRSPLKESNLAHHRDIYTLMFMTAQSTTAKLENQTKCSPVNKWIRKLWHTYSVLFVHKNKIVSF